MGIEAKLQNGGSEQINKEIIYQSIRDEILDQKKCQFQIFSIAVAVTSVILAYALRDNVKEFALVAPIVMNTLALVIIVDKAISIQRKVGYLQIMEAGIAERKIIPSTPWRWESHLDKFRIGDGHTEKDKKKEVIKEKRKHSYITFIGMMLLALNLFCMLLLGVFVWEKYSPKWDQKFHFNPENMGVVITLFFSLTAFGFGVITFWMKKYSLVSGKNNTFKIKKRWENIIKQDKD